MPAPSYQGRLSETGKMPCFACFVVFAVGRVKVAACIRRSSDGIDLGHQTTLERQQLEACPAQLSAPMTGCNWAEQFWNHCCPLQAADLKLCNDGTSLCPLTGKSPRCVLSSLLRAWAAACQEARCFSTGAELRRMHGGTCAVL